MTIELTEAEERASGFWQYARRIEKRTRGKMLFYHTTKTTEGGNSATSEWFTNKREAEKCAAQWVKDNPDEWARIYEWEIEPTKQGILRALNLHASHPDNG
jgi:hypothetical protein